MRNDDYNNENVNEIYSDDNYLNKEIDKVKLWIVISGILVIIIIIIVLMFKNNEKSQVNDKMPQSIISSYNI